MSPRVGRQNAPVAALGIAVAALSLGTLALLAMAPVYTDEITWKVLLGRYFPDGRQEIALTLMPSCGAYAKPVPWPLLPFRLAGAAVYGALTDPLRVRLFGLATMLAWLALTWRLVRAALIGAGLGPATTGGTAALGVLAFATLGVLPFMLEFGRPEQILLIGMTAMYLPLLKPATEPPPGFGRGLLCAAGIVLLACLLLATHPRATLALPLILVFAARWLRRAWLAAAATLAILAFAAASYIDWAARWACPGDKVIRAMFLKLNLGANTSFADLMQYWGALLPSLAGMGGWFIGAIRPSPYFTSDMLPPFTNYGWIGFGLVLTLILTYAAILGAAAFVLAVAGRWREREFRWGLAATAALWLFYAASVVARIEKNDYEAALMVPVLGLAVFGSLFLAWPVLLRRYGARPRRWAEAGFAGLLLLSALSQAGTLWTYAPYAATRWTTPGYPEGQRFSVGNFGYSSLRPQILRAAARCGLDPATHPHHPVLDELTYFAFRHAYQPFFMTELDEHGWSRHRPDPTRLLTQWRSAGMIVGCQWVPTALKARAVADGRFCCLPAFR